MKKEDKTKITIPEKTTNTTEKVPVFCSQRWILAYLFFWGYFFTYAVRVNISVAIVCMVKTPFDNSTLSRTFQNYSTEDQCGSLESQTKSHNERAEFEWDKATKSSLLSSFFYGYALTQIPGGWLADRFGGKRVYGAAMAIAGIATILMPVCARTNIILLYALRVICGLATGTCFPAGQSMWGRWAPKMERTKLVCTGQVGAWIGTVVTFGGSGALCEYGFDNGWGSIFYVTGGLTCIWVIIWFYQVRDIPMDHPRITDDERNHIINHVEYDASKRTAKVPWRDMIKSGPLWAIIIAHSFGNWGVYTLLTSLPEFMKSVQKFDIKSNGVLSAIPYLCSAAMALTAGQIADLLRSKRVLTTTQVRRLFQGTAFVFSAIFLVATGFVPCEKRNLAVVFLCFALLFNGFTRGGYAVNHIDIAPKYGGFLYGVTNTAATIPGMLAPVVAAALTPDDTPEQWRNVFYVSAAFCISGAILYGILVSGEIQYWALDKTPVIETTVEMPLLANGVNGKQSETVTNHTDT